jgi:hypothetical protein
MRIVYCSEPFAPAKVDPAYEAEADAARRAGLDVSLVSFEALAEHSKSGMPLTKEYRLFFLDGRLLYAAEYWEEGDYGGTAPPVDLFSRVAERVRSRFFTMDVAKRCDGEWMIVELGDAQVAGLPDRADADTFYAALARSADD